jgi:hypothetical protein
VLDLDLALRIQQKTVPMSLGTVVRVSVGWRSTTAVVMTASATWSPAAICC